MQFSVLAQDFTNLMLAVDGNDKFVSKAAAVFEKNEIAEIRELLPRPMDKLELLVANFGRVTTGLDGFLQRVL